MIELFIIMVVIAVAGWLSVSVAIQQYKIMALRFNKGMHVSGMFNFIFMLCSPFIFIFVIMFGLTFIQLFYIFTTGQIYY
jgi:hypothetical protein